MDRSWIQLSNRNSIEFEHGVKEFISFVKGHLESGKDPDLVVCPCIMCNNRDKLTLDQVEDHIFIFGMVKGYTKWTYHGESFESSEEEEEIENDCNLDEDEVFNDVQEMLHDMHRGSSSNDSTSMHMPNDLNGVCNMFTRMMKDAEQELYPGCRSFSKLSFIVHLLHIKLKNGWSNKSFTDLLSLLKKALPNGESLPESYYEAKKIIRDLGHSYEKIHVCKNDCILFWKEHKDAEICPVCKGSRYKKEEGKSKKVPHKVLRYFPLKKRLQRLYISKVTAKNMRWHNDERIDDGILRHPADAEAWKDFDTTHPVFSADCRNVRLGLACDGFDPFGGKTYSMWPVFIVPYNLPPCLCMKDQFIIMSLLIPGRRAPGINIDVFLRPLIDDLHELWEIGIDSYDAYSGNRFQLHAVLLWTINDFPAYGDLSGWSTKGKLACPSCNKDASHKYLKYWGSTCYIGHRRFLPLDHHFRKSKAFDGKNEYRSPPKQFSGYDIVEQLEKVEQPIFGRKDENNKKRKRSARFLNWSKKSIFFTLSYWKTLMLRHNLDVMHIEKNICDNIIGTLMDIEGKTKDSYKSRLDMEAMRIHKKLHPVLVDGQTYLPGAWYTFSTSEKKEFCEFLYSTKFPDSYASNTSQYVNLEICEMKGLKSHDCHIILQQLLPVAIRGSLRNDVRLVLIELGLFFRALTSKTVKLDGLDSLEKDIVLILCKLEKLYPPSFFTIMMHLSVHLVHEVRLGGPVQYRWMYPFERCMHKLKAFIRNNARPEGSIAEGYIDNECLLFCSMYLDGVETKFNKAERNEDGCDRQQVEGLSIFTQKARHLGGTIYDELSHSDFEKVKLYVLNNCEEVDPFRMLYQLEVERPVISSGENHPIPEFHVWFLNHVSQLYKQNPSATTKQLLSLARGPDRRVTRYTGCVTNGLRFHTKEREMHLRVQNSGVVVDGDYKGERTEFYGVLKDIIEVSYLGDNKVLLFKCDWWNVGSSKTGIRKDQYNFVSVNVTKTWYKEDPFVLASQARQVFYLDDKVMGKSWRVVQKSQPRSIYDIPANDIANDEFEVHQEDEMQMADVSLNVEDEDFELHQDDGMLHSNTINIDTNNTIVDDSYESDKELVLSSDGGESDDIREEGLIDDDTDEEDYY